MADAATMLLQDKNILDFLKVMHGANRSQQANEYAELFASMDTMQNQLNETLAELKNVRSQLDAMQTGPIKRAFTAAVDKLQAQVKAVQTQLNAMKEKLITAAKTAVQGFKEKSQAALNGVLKFFNIKKELQDTVKSCSSLIQSCNKSIAKIEAISNEYHATGLHMKNMGRAVVGKDAVVNQKPKGKLAKSLQAVIRFRRNLSNGCKKTCEKALAKLENLENTVQSNRDRTNERKAAKKSSLMKRMDTHKQTTEKQQQAPTTSKKREEVL